MPTLLLVDLLAANLPATTGSSRLAGAITDGKFAGAMAGNSR
jgi:hypothetical protein